MTSNDPVKLLIKVGGNALIGSDAMASFAATVAKLKNANFEIVLSHGGGPQISAAFEVAGIENSFIGGFRYTTKQGAQIVKRVLCEEIQKDLINHLSNFNLEVTGLCGDQGIFYCKKRESLTSGERADLGFVGDVVSVDSTEIQNQMSQHKIPIVSAVGYDNSGNTYNINADTGAAFLAAQLNMDYLVLLTDVDGVYADWPRLDSLLARINREELAALIKRVEKGMAPKLEAARIGLNDGVESVVILNGSNGEALEKYFLVNERIGTTIR